LKKALFAKKFFKNFRNFEKISEILKKTMVSERGHALRRAGECASQSWPKLAQNNPS
jgi:hypothetical protein